MGAVSSLLSSSEVSVPMERRLEYLKKTPFFIFLSEDQLNEFAKCFPSAFKVKESASLKLNDSIVHVVAEGELELRTTLPCSSRQKIESSGYLCKKGPGDIVNMRESIRDAQRRVAQKKLKKFVDDIMTCASSQSLVLRCNPSLLQTFQSQNPDLSSKIEAILTAHIDQFLSPLPFLKDVKESQLHVLAAMCRYEAFDAGELVFEEGTLGSKLYILLDGKVAVFVNNQSSSSSSSSLPTNGMALQRSLENTIKGSSSYDIAGNDSGGSDLVQIASFETGDYFGETALIMNIPRTTTIKTMNKTLFVTVARKDFENFLMVCPIKDDMLMVMKERMLSKLTSVGIPFLVGIPGEKLSSLSVSATITEMKEGDVVFREGDKGDRFYIVVYGEVKVETMSSSAQEKSKDDDDERQDGHGNDSNTTEEQKINLEGEHDKNTSSPSDPPPMMELTRLGPGKYFGETALVTDAPRSATITVFSKKLILLSVDKDSFHKIFDENSQLLAEFELRVMKANCELIHVLRCDGGLAVYRSFLEKEMAVENLNFWMEAKTFKEGALPANEMIVAARKIYELYCDDASDQQVNIPGMMREELKKNIDSGDINETLFEDARKEIYKLMMRDKFQRFKTSIGFKDFLANFGISL